MADNKHMDEEMMDYEPIIVTFTDEAGNERHFAEEMRIPMNGEEYALLVGLNTEGDEDFDEEENVTIAKITKDEDGEDVYIVDFPEEEFDRVVEEYNRICDEMEAE
ncbi:DUF1292 domain-containing protein [uncultured Anaerovibrio sp.]|uniref:DUF1292 domain-containing protein n=1 Tax=uncultured Anaerovibrio sp. TaxID=361586 RepID=UPI0025CE1A4A|nr:DUF1292 domain-containing protein [uncultured Anaerovibrio sp.]